MFGLLRLFCFVLLCCIVPKKVRKPSTLLAHTCLVSTLYGRAFVEVVCSAINKQIKAIKINTLKSLIHLGSISAAFSSLRLVIKPMIPDPALFL